MKELPRNAFLCSWIQELKVDESFLAGGLSYLAFLNKDDKIFKLY
jgi:hypothetical protein